MEVLNGEMREGLAKLLEYCDPKLVEKEEPLDPEKADEDLPTGPDGEVVELPKEEEEIDPCGCPLLSEQAKPEVYPLLENEIEERYELTFLNF